MDKRYLIIYFFMIFFISCDSEVLEKFDDGEEGFCPTTRLSDGSCPKSTSQTLGWSFSNSNQYIYDSKFISIDSGAKLKTVNTRFESDSFTLGSNSKAELNNSKLKILSNSSDETELNESWTPKFKNLIGYWKLDGDGQDSSGNNSHAIIQGDTSFSSNTVVGDQAASFDGANDYFDIMSIKDSFDVDKGTISTWVKRSGPVTSYYMNIFTYSISSGNGMSIICFAQTAGDGSGHLRISGKRNNIFFSAASPSYHTGCEDILPLNTWVHIGATWDYAASEVKLYVNGRLIETGTITGVMESSPPTEISISYNNSIRAWNGSIDDFAVFNTPLTASELKSIYERQKNSYGELSSSWAPHFDSLVGYWKMDGNWQDSSGNNNHATAYNESTFTENNKVGSHAGSFDGSSDYLDISNALSDFNHDEGSLSTWVKRTADVTSYHRYIFTYNIDSNNSMFLSCYGNTGTDGSGSIRFAGKRNGDFFQAASPSGDNGCTDALPLNEWVHITVTWSISKNEVRLYANGELINQGIYTSPMIGTATNAYISANSHNRAWPGFLDDYAIWKTPLSKADVALIYNRQKQKYAGSYESPVIDFGATQLLTQLKPTTELPFGKELTSSLESQLDYKSLTKNLSDRLVGYWPLNETELTTGDNNDFLNLVGSSYHAESVGTVTPGKKGILGQSAKLEAGNSAIEIDELASYVNTSVDEGTMSAWVYREFEDDTSTYHGLFYIGQSFTKFLQGYYHYGNDTWIFQRVGEGTFSLAPSQIPKGKWTHVAMTWSELTNTLKVYINGKEAGSATGVSDISAATNFRFGQWNTTAGLEGKMDEAAFWSRALDADDVQELYRRSANRVKYQVRACSDSTCSTDPEWTGPGGDGSTFFSESYNRDLTNLTNMFSGCDASDDNICSAGEVSIEGEVQVAQPNFYFGDFVAGELSSPYFQYRVLMEAEENTACDGKPCLPTLTSLSFEPSGKYYAGKPSVQSKTAISLTRAIKNVKETKTGSCTPTYQFSKDNSNWKYWDGAGWSAATSSSQANAIGVVAKNLNSLVSIGDKLYIKAFLNSDGSQACTLRSVSL